MSKSEYRDEDKTAFIEQCGRLREELSKSNPEMRLSIAFALTELQDMDALALILEDHDLRLNIRSFVIYENMDVIENTVKRGPSQKELETLVAAVCAYPEEDGRLYELVTSAVENAPFYTQNEKSTILDGMSTPLARADLGYISYAVYRDGVELQVPNVDVWHAALMDVYYKTSSGDVVIHALKYSYMSYGTWYEFLTGQGAGGDYMGTYRPNASMSSLARGNVNARANYLVDEGIAYYLLKQMSISTSGLSVGDKIPVGNILSIRCDGVVEYCYEYYGFRVYGSDTLWDISTHGAGVIDHHSYLFISPREQAEDYLTQVLDEDTEPTQ
ncbi:hypothetical protein SDC9_103807 [bioreactor metagenome]|uniref:Uncharacterized protein n=1 Tax=bioreactor metagenome TaxID=1076179 RepID=A0A645AV25_9ZZZZ